MSTGVAQDEAWIPAQEPAVRNLGTLRVHDAPDEARSVGCTLPTVMVGGFPTVAVTRRELADVMVADCLHARSSGGAFLPTLVFSSNGQGVALAGRSSSFARTMASADIIHADGMPVVMASRLTHTPLPERVATTDFFHDAATAASVHGLRFFILGASEAQNAAVVRAVNQLYPAVKVVGSHHGYFSEDEEDYVCELIRKSRADVVWVAMGKPRQEEWSVRNREKLGGVGWIKTCGGLYAFLTGDSRRAPMWMRRWGLEWAYRAMHEPRRLAWRYLVTNPYALVRLLVRTER